MFFNYNSIKRKFENTKNKIQISTELEITIPTLRSKMFQDLGTDQCVAGAEALDLSSPDKGSNKTQSRLTGALTDPQLVQILRGLDTLHSLSRTSQLQTR